MALTIANVSHPNQQVTEWPFGPFKCRLINVTFDNSYLTTGEVLTAATLGWNQIHGAIALDGGITTSTGTVMANIVARPNAARTQIAFQAYETAGTVDTAHKEVTSATDLSTYSGRFLIIGS